MSARLARKRNVINGKAQTDSEYKTKLNAEIHINELAEIARSKRNSKVVPDTKNHKFAKNGFIYRTAYFEDFDGSFYRVTISIGLNGNVSTVYNVGKIKEDTIPGGTTVSTLSGSKAVDVSSESILSQNNQKSNPSAQNNSDSGNAKDITGPKSKDDTILDDEDDERLLFTDDGDLSFENADPTLGNSIDVQRLLKNAAASPRSACRQANLFGDRLPDQPRRKGYHVLLPRQL